MRTFVASLLFLSLSCLVSGCLDCAECTDCIDPVYDQEMCFRENRDYYSDRREWRDDVKAYEALFECNCR
ncbi:MAG: hypothetical protein RLP15_04040 [Cryomorphaceae bacterium]